MTTYLPFFFLIPPLRILVFMDGMYWGMYGSGNLV